MLIIDETGTADTVSTDTYAVGRETNLTDDRHIGFKLLAALSTLIHKGLQCKLIVLLDDSTLLYRPGVDSWAMSQLHKYDAGLLGVASETSYAGWFTDCLGFFDQWGLPYTFHEVGERPVAEGVYFLSAKFANELFARGLMPPIGWQEWPITAGAFLSWTAQMLGYPQISWGTQDRPRAPLFVDAAVSRRLPAPSTIAEQFSLHSSIRRVRGYSETEIREWAAYLRAGE